MKREYLILQVLIQEGSQELVSFLLADVST